MITEESPTTSNGGYRMSRDRRAVTVGNELQCPGLAGQTFSGSTPSDQEPSREHQRVTASILRGTTLKPFGSVRIHLE